MFFDYVQSSVCVADIVLSMMCKSETKQKFNILAG